MADSAMTLDLQRARFKIICLKGLWLVMSKSEIADENLRSVAVTRRGFCLSQLFLLRESRAPTGTAFRWFSSLDVSQKTILSAAEAVLAMLQGLARLTDEDFMPFGAI